MGWFGKLKRDLGFGASQQDNNSGASQHSDLIKSAEFSATLQLRTPLRILRKDGEIHQDLKSPPPSYAKEQWEGSWTPKLDSKFDFLSEGATISTEIGPISLVQKDRMLAFLIAVRKVVETELSIEERRKKLKELLRTTEWPEVTLIYGENVQNISLSKAFGGDVQIVDRLFPPFLKTISGLSKDSIDQLYEANLRTPDALERTSDETLLKVKGIGPSKLKMIREICSSTTDKYAEWTD